MLEQLKESSRREDAAELEQLLAPRAPEQPKPTAPMPVSEAAADNELRQIFVEEARDVLDSIVEQLEMLRSTRDDQATLTTVRRAFHTLKGSSRMVGFKTVGEGAWAVEQCFNLWLAQERAASDDLLDLADGAQRVVRDWINQIARNPAAGPDPIPLVRAAQAVREGGAFEYAHALTGDASRPKSDGSAAAVVVDALPADPDRNGRCGHRRSTASGAPPFGDDLRSTMRRRRSQSSDWSLETELCAPVAPLASVPLSMPEEPGSEDIKRIGPLEISHGLYSIFLTEADECIRVLANDIAEWRYEPARGVTPAIMRRAHSLSGISKTVGLAPVVSIAEPLDDLMRTLTMHGPRHLALTPAQFDTLERATDRVRGMLHQFAAGVYPDEAPLDAGALRDLVSVVRAHSALHDDAPGGSALHLVQADDAIEQDMQAAVFDVVEPAHSVVDDVDAMPAPAAGQQFGAQPADEKGEDSVFAEQAPAATEDQDSGDATAESEQPAASRLRDEIDAELLRCF